MIYLFECNECKHAASRTLDVEQRDRAFPCSVCETGIMRRSYKLELKTKRIITWSAWCESTAEMLRPTYEDDKAYDKSLSEVKRAPKKKHVKAKEKRETFDKLHGMVEAGII